MREIQNQFECKTAKKGEILYYTDLTGDVLLFVSKGNILICDQEQKALTEVQAGQFVLLSAAACQIVKALTPVQTILMFAGPLVDMLIADPEWDPDLPVVLPIFPELTRTLYLIENYQKEKRNNLN